MPRMRTGLLIFFSPYCSGYLPGDTSKQLMTGVPLLLEPPHDYGCVKKAGNFCVERKNICRLVGKQRVENLIPLMETSDRLLSHIYFLLMASSLLTFCAEAHSRFIESISCY